MCAIYRARKDKFAAPDIGTIARYWAVFAPEHFTEGSREVVVNYCVK